jgi:hypothetical protein
VRNVEKNWKKKVALFSKKFAPSDTTAFPDAQLHTIV